MQERGWGVPQPSTKRFNMFGANSAFHGASFPPFWMASASDSSSKSTAALISRISARRRGSFGGSLLSLERAAVASSSRCLDISQRGEKGKKNIPKKRIQANMI